MKVKVDITNFSQTIRELARVARVEPEQALRFELSKVLEKAAKDTIAADSGKIKTRYRNKKNDKNLKSKKNKIMVDGKLYSFARRYPNKVWQRLLTENNKNMNERLKRRGLAKKSWPDIAKAFGLSIKVPGYVSKARAKGKEVIQSTGKVNRGQNGNIVSFEGTNAMQSAISPGGKGRQALYAAVEGRIKYFANNLKRGVFSSIASARSKYKGVEVS